MPLFDAPPEAVDRVYAASLFELAEAQGGEDRLKEVVAEFDDIVELAKAQPEFSEFLSSRILGIDDRAASLRKIFENSGMSPLVLHFLLVLNSKGRLARLLSVIAAYAEMVDSKFGRIEVNVYTKDALDQSMIDHIRQTLQSSLGREPVVYAYTEAGMLGGVKMQIGDRLFDDSLRTQIRNMSDLFKDHGAAMMRTNAGRAIDDQQSA